MPTRKTTKAAPVANSTKATKAAPATQAGPATKATKGIKATGMTTAAEAAPAAKATGRRAAAGSPPGSGTAAASSAAGTAPRQSLVIYVHGIGDHPASDALKLQWDLALFGKDLRDRSRMAYWADLLHPVPSAAAAKKATAEAASRSPAAKKARAKAAESQAEAAGPADSTGLDIVQLLAEAHVDPDTPGAEAFAHDLLQVLGAPPQPLVIGPGKKLLPLPPALRRPLSRAFLKAFVADTAAYFFGDGVRGKIRQRLVDVLKAAAGRSRWSRTARARSSRTRCCPPSARPPAASKRWSPSARRSASPRCRTGWSRTTARCPTSSGDGTTSPTRWTRWRWTSAWAATSTRRRRSRTS
jgi:hypothetical protein